MGIYKETIRKYMVGHQMRQVVSNNGVLDLAQFYLDATAMGATQDKPLFEAELNALPTLAKNEAETILVPGVYKNGKVYGLNGSTKGLVEFDFSRASSATYFDKNGIMQTAVAGVPRIDHDPITKACRGYLLEAPGINLAPNSVIGTTDTNWSLGALLGKGSVVTTPASGLTTLVQAIPISPGTVYTFSFFVKVATGKMPDINPFGDFAVLLNGSSSWGIISQTSIHIGNGVYRVSCTSNSDTWATGSGMGIVKRTGDSGLTVTVTGFQLETGNDSSSYIPSSGAAAIRAIDALQSASDIVPYADASVLMDFTPLNTSQQTRSIYLQRSLSGQFWYANHVETAVSTDGTGVVDVSNQVVRGENSKVLTSFGASGLRMAANGNPPKTASTFSGSFGSGMIEFNKGSGFIKTHVKSLAIFSRQLTDQEHIDITV